MATLAQQCYTPIETKILNGEYKPGEKLGMQVRRVDLGIGLSPIREALSKMVSTGLVQAVLFVWGASLPHNTENVRRPQEAMVSLYKAMSCQFQYVFSKFAQIQNYLWLIDGAH